MNVLLLGGGSREHALAQIIYRSPLLGTLYAAPGNPGIGRFAECISLSTLDARALIVFCKAKAIGLVVIGPEEPAVRGVSDALRDVGIAVFAPSQAAAVLEGSKVLAKQFMDRHGIPTAEWKAASTLGETINAMREFGYPKKPLFLKANGLCAGKGAFPIYTENDFGKASVPLFFENRFGNQTLPVIVEKALKGTETSVFYLCSGTSAIRLPTARDYKRRDDHDCGLNTGGMGAFSPSDIMTPELEDRIEQTIVRPTLRGMVEEDAAFIGILYVGIMLTEKGPYVIEYNVRFGDPEAQVILPRIKDDLVELFYAAATGNLVERELNINPQPVVCVNATGIGYPTDDVKGGIISGLHSAESGVGVTIFHAGTTDEDGVLKAGGGRVLSVCGKATMLVEARERAYSAISQIRFENGGPHYRNDIAGHA